MKACSNLLNGSIHANAMCDIMDMLPDACMASTCLSLRDRFQPWISVTSGGPSMRESTGNHEGNQQRNTPLTARLSAAGVQEALMPALET